MPVADGHVAARCLEQTHRMGAVEAPGQTVIDPVLLDLACELGVPTGDAHECHRRPQHSTPIAVFRGLTLTCRLHSQDAARRLPDDERIVDPPIPLRPLRLAGTALESLYGLIGQPLDLGRHVVRRLLQTTDDRLPLAFGAHDGPERSGTGELRQRQSGRHHSRPPCRWPGPGRDRTERDQRAPSSASRARGPSRRPPSVESVVRGAAPGNTAAARPPGSRHWAPASARPTCASNACTASSASRN